MSTKRDTAPTAGQYTPRGEMIEDDGFVTVYPDLYKNETPAPQATDFSPLCANPSGVNPAF